MKNISFLSIIICLFINVAQANQCAISLKKVISSISKKREILHSLKVSSNNNDISSYHTTIMKYYDNFFPDKGGVLNGQSIKRDKTLITLMKKNNNSYIPSYYQYYYNKEDVFGVLSHINNKTKSETKEWESSFDDAFRWIDEYRGYEKRIQEEIDEGFQARIQLTELKEFGKGGKKEIMYEQFSSANIISIPLTYVSNGKRKIKIRNFSSMLSFRTYIVDLKKTVRDVFLQSFMDEIFWKSEVYESLLDHAIKRRMLSFLYATLIDLGKDASHIKQRQLKEQLELVLRDNLLNPASSAISRIEKRELKYEFLARLKRKKGKRKSRAQFKYGLLTETIKEIDNSTPNIFNYGKVMAATAMTGAFATTFFALTSPVAENPYYNYSLSLFQNSWNDLWIDLTGTSSLLLTAAKEWRGVSLENSSLNKYLYAHLSRFLFKNQIDPTYNYLTDPKFLKRRKFLINLMLDRRNKLGFGEFFTENLSYLKKKGYQNYMDQNFISSIKLSYPQFEKKLTPVFDKLSISAGKIETIEALNIVKDDIDLELYLLIKSYIEQADNGLNHLRDFGTVMELDSFRKFSSDMDSLIVQ